MMPDHDWTAFDLRRAEDWYRRHLGLSKAVPFEVDPMEFRYRKANDWFPLSDAWVLGCMIEMEPADRIIEIGSGHSTAAILDTIDFCCLGTAVTTIDPDPSRLLSVLGGTVPPCLEILPMRVQEVGIGPFLDLRAGDILFIDSSHLAAEGSDVAALLLAVLPRLAPGVLVHLHDVFWPSGYPDEWQSLGWNESLFLRAFLTENPRWEILAFNSWAAANMRGFFERELPEFLEAPGGSIWLHRLPAQAAC